MAPLLPLLCRVTYLEYWKSLFLHRVPVKIISCNGALQGPQASFTNSAPVFAEHELCCSPWK